MDISSSYAPVAGLVSSVPFGWIVVAVLATLLTLDALRSGIARATALSIALPLAFILHQFLNTAVLLGPLVTPVVSPLAQALIFGVLLVALFILVYKMVDSYSADTYGIFSAILVGLATTTVLVVVWSLVPSLMSFWDFGASVQSVFGEGNRFWLLLAAFIGLAFARS